MVFRIISNKHFLALFDLVAPLLVFKIWSLHQIGLQVLGWRVAGGEYHYFWILFKLRAPLLSVYCWESLLLALGSFRFLRGVGGLSLRYNVSISGNHQAGVRDFRELDDVPERLPEVVGSGPEFSSPWLVQILSQLIDEGLRNSIQHIDFSLGCDLLD